MRVALALLRGDEGRRYFQVTLQIWEELGRRLQVKRWADVPDQTIVAIAFGANPEVNEAVVAFLPPHEPSDVLLEMEHADVDRRRELRGLIVMAYLARAAQRPDLDLESLTNEMGGVWTWLFCHDELVNRLERHRMGSLLYVLTIASRWGAGKGPTRYPALFQGGLDKAADKWMSRASKSVGLSWAIGVLGETDALETKKEVRGLLGKRLAQELKRLRGIPSDQLSLEAIQGRLDYHRSAAKQAIIDVGRQTWPKERHILSQDPHAAAELDQQRVQLDQDQVVRPRKGAKTSLPRGEAKEPEDPDQVAAAVARAFRLPPAQVRVVRWITTQSGKYTQPEIAEGANVSLSTVEATIRKLVGDLPKLLTILSP